MKTPHGASLQAGEELVDVGGGGGPAGGKTYNGMSVVVLFPEAESCLTVRAKDKAVGENDEELIGRRLEEERYVFGVQAFFQHFSHAERVTSEACVEVVGEQREELYSRYSSFCQERSVLLDDGEEIGYETRVGHDDRLSEERSTFCSTDIEDVDQPCEVRQREVVLRTSQRISQPCSVDIKGNVVLAAHVVYVRHFRLGIDGSILRWLREIHHSRHDHVAVVGVGIEIRDVAVDVSRRNFS